MQTTLSPRSASDEVAAHLAEEVAELFPGDGRCTEEDYLAADTNLLVELSSHPGFADTNRQTSSQRCISHRTALDVCPTCEVGNRSLRCIKA